MKENKEILTPEEILDDIIYNKIYRLLKDNTDSEDIEELKECFKYYHKQMTES